MANEAADRLCPNCQVSKANHGPECSVTFDELEEAAETNPEK